MLSGVKWLRIDDHVDVHLVALADHLRFLLRLWSRPDRVFSASAKNFICLSMISDAGIACA